MTSCSQAHQDLFVVAATRGKRSGSFIDLGAFHQREGNNTFLLEKEYGWMGLSMDIVKQSWDDRSSIFATGDATRKSDLIHINPETTYDYLSLDIDLDTNKCLVALIEMDLINKFQVITIEHDRYARGTSYREFQRKILTSRDYVMVAGDVFPPGRPDLPFEDWWVSPAIQIPSTAPQSTESLEVAKWFWEFTFNQPLP